MVTNQPIMVYTAFEWQLYHQSSDVRMKKGTIIERKQEFPGRLRTAIDEATEENLSPAFFLSRIESTLADLLFENWWAGHVDDSKAPNCDRDTEAEAEAEVEVEVELAIRFFPNVLSMKRNGYYPIYWQLKSCVGEYNLKAALFVPLLAKLAIELNQCEEGERGGLICCGLNMLKGFASICGFASPYDYKNYDEERRELLAETFLAVMKRLRENGIFKKEDILEYNLMRILCSHSIFPEQRFRYLADWDPSCLMTTCNDGWLHIYRATWYCKDIRGFRTVFELGIHHFPKEMGGLFHKDRHGRTAYRLACDRFGNEEVKNILDNGFRKNHTNTSTWSILKSLVYASSDEAVHLDGVFELLQRELSVLQVQAAIK